MRRRFNNVDRDSLINSIRCALEENIANGIIVDSLMNYIENNVDTVLEDDCDEVEE